MADAAENTSDDATRRPRGRPRNPAVDDALLASTLGKLAAEGYARLTLDSLAEAAAVTKPTIYRRFKNKDEVIVAAVERMASPKMPSRSGDVYEDLLVAVREIRKAFSDPGTSSLLGTMLVEERHTPELVMRLRARLFSPWRDHLGEILDDGVKSGQVRRDAPTEVVVALLLGWVLGRSLDSGPPGSTWPKRVVDLVWPAIAAPTLGA